MDISFDISIAEVILGILVFAQHVRQSLADRKLTAEEVEVIFSKVAEVFTSENKKD
jgi:hypothetical protein